MSGLVLPGLSQRARAYGKITPAQGARAPISEEKLYLRRYPALTVCVEGEAFAERIAAYPPVAFVCYISAMNRSSLGLVSRRAWVFGLVGGVVGAGGLVAGCGGGADVPVGPHEGKRAPAIRLPRLDGSSFELSDAPDTPVMLVFWASWCGPCRREATEVAEIVRSYGSRVAVVSINSGEDPTKAAIAAKEWGMTWPVALDSLGAASQAYAVQALPTVVVVDRQGIVRYRGNGMPSDAHRLLDGLAG